MSADAIHNDFPATVAAGLEPTPHVQSVTTQQTIATAPKLTSCELAEAYTKALAKGVKVKGTREGDGAFQLRMRTADPVFQKIEPAAAAIVKAAIMKAGEKAGTVYGDEFTVITPIINRTSTGEIIDIPQSAQIPLLNTRTFPEQQILESIAELRQDLATGWHKGSGDFYYNVTAFQKNGIDPYDFLALMPKGSASKKNVMYGTGKLNGAYDNGKPTSAYALGADEALAQRAPATGLWFTAAQVSQLAAAVGFEDPIPALSSSRYTEDKSASTALT